VLRRFEDFASAEVRSWWIDGQCKLVTAHPDTPAELPPPDLDLAGLSPLVGSLGLPFITVDLVRRADGVWRVVEVGDGQVSDRPVTTGPDAFIAAILTAAR
jgi:ATP-grasp domain, R2K clade family 3